MLQVKQTIRLHYEGRGYREISIMLAISSKTVTKYFLLFKSTGLSYEDIKDYSESEKYSMMCEREKPTINRLEIYEQ